MSDTDELSNSVAIVEKLAIKHGLTRSKAQQFLNSVVDTIGEELEQGKKIKIRGLGTFSVKRLAAKQFRNVITKQLEMRPESNVVKFKQSTRLAERTKDWTP